MNFRENGRQADLAEPLTRDMHQEALHDLTLLEDSRILLVQRLERVVVALTLTLDAEAAAEERLVRMQELAGVQRISDRPAVEWARLAQRYRDVLHAIESIDDDALLDDGGNRS